LSREPAIDKPAILRALRQAYDLPIESVTFMTSGWASYIYRGEIAGGASCLVKVYDESLPEPLLATSRDFYLPLTHQLCAKGLLTSIACPVQAPDGRFSIGVGQHRIIVFHFIEGHAIGFGPLPDEVLVKLAGLIGRLHSSTGSLELRSPLTEDFRIAFERLLPAGMDALTGVSPGNRHGWAEWRDLLLPRRDEILEYLRRLRHLQAVMRSHPRRMVVCHTDLHGGNLILNGAGDLYIVDWEGAQLAPPEQDLFFFAGEDTFHGLFWPNYAREFPEATLGLDALGFYFYRRGLEDLAEWIQRLLHTEQSQEQASRALHWAAQTLSELARTEATLEKLRGT
jgi:Ser/Thr protein kinase RdoA (MazF antagonist)